MDSDQIDGGNVSHRKKKGVRVSEKHVASSEWDRRTDQPMVQTNLNAPSPTDNPTIISIGPRCWPTVSVESQPDDYTYTDEWNRDSHPDNLYPEAGIPSVSKQTMEELKSLLRERAILNSRERDEDQLTGHHCHKPGQRIDCKPDDIQSKSFSTFKPVLESSQKTRDSASSGWESGVSSKNGGLTNRRTSSMLPASENTYWVDTGTAQRG